MRIAIVSDYFMDYVGGAQSSILEQKASLEEQGHVVHLVAAVSASRGATAAVDLPIRALFTVPGLQLPVVANSRRVVTRLAEYFYAEGIQVVHPQTEFGLANAAVTAARQLGLPVVHTVHTLYWTSTGVGPTIAAPAMRALLRRITGVQPPRHALSDRPSDNLLRNLTIALSSRADVVVSPSEHQAADLAATGLERLAVVPNPIARSHRPAVLLTAEQAARPRILWVARCEPEKRPVVFATAVLDALERTGGAFEVDFVGDGSELAEVRLLTADAPQFHVLGSLTHEAVLDLIDGSSIVALTSYGFDNQPMTIAESVSRYRGVLFCDPRLREGLGDSGALSATPDATALADTIVDLVTHPERLVALSEGAERDSTTFSAATYVERVLAVYRDAACIAAAAQTD